MKLFNLKRALAGDPVVMRDGRIVTDLHYFKDATKDQPLCGVVDGIIFSWTLNGCYHGDEAQSPCDLFMISAQRAGWLNIYKDCVGGLYDNKGLADMEAARDRIACIQVTYEEGEGL